MSSLKDLEDSLRNFIVQEQSDAHNSRSVNIVKYNNLKMWMEPSKHHESHVIIRISISEAVFLLKDFSKINGSLGYEERFVYKWFNRIGIKEKLKERWKDIEKNMG